MSHLRFEVRCPAGEKAPLDLSAGRTYELHPGHVIHDGGTPTVVECTGRPQHLTVRMRPASGRLPSTTASNRCTSR